MANNLEKELQSPYESIDCNDMAKGYLEMSQINLELAQEAFIASESALSSYEKFLKED